MKKFFKFVIIITLMIPVSYISACLEYPSEIGLDSLPKELATVILRPKIDDIINKFKSKRNFKKLSREIGELRLSSKNMNNNIAYILSPKFINSLIIKEINMYSYFPISKIALAKALLTKNEFEDYAKENIDWHKANEIMTNFLKSKKNDGDLSRAIENGANLDMIIDKEGNTYLLEESKLGTYDQVIFLVRAGADVNKKNNKGETALLLAVPTDTDQLIEILINAGADLNAQDLNGNTALMNAIINGYNIIAEKLINSGADKNIQNNNGDTALSLANKMDNYDMVDYLTGESELIEFYKLKDELINLIKGMQI